MIPELCLHVSKDSFDYKLRYLEILSICDKIFPIQPIFPYMANIFRDNIANKTN